MSTVQSVMPLYNSLNSLRKDLTDFGFCWKSKQLSSGSVERKEASLLPITYLKINVFVNSNLVNDSEQALS